MRTAQFTAPLLVLFALVPSHRLASSATNDVLQVWTKRQIVAMAEGHRIVQDKQFLRELIATPAFPQTVRDIVVEFASSRYQAVLDQYIQGADVPERDLRRVWGDTTVVSGVWDAPIYQEFFAAVRERNKFLPNGSRVRVLACDPPIDWSHVSTIAEAAPSLDRDTYCAALVEREVIARNHRALLLMGEGHVARRNGVGNATKNTVGLIEAKHQNSVFVIVTYLGQYRESAAIEDRLSNGPIPALVSLSDAWPGDLLAAPPRALTRTRVGPGQPPTTETVAVAHPPRFREIADALLYLGPKETLTRSAPEAGHWSPDELDELDRRNQILFGQSLDRSVLFK
jgi:hypothetical protein